MIEGACHCGAVRWTFDGVPAEATACNCTLCRRYGGLWAYDFEDERIHVSGETHTYVWGDRKLAFHRCAACGCIVYTRWLQANEDGRRRLSVNLRTAADPQAVAGIPVRHLDGFDTWERRPGDGGCVADLWF